MPTNCLRHWVERYLGGGFLRLMGARPHVTGSPRIGGGVCTTVSSAEKQFICCTLLAVECSSQRSSCRSPARDGGTGKEEKERKKKKKEEKSEEEKSNKRHPIQPQPIPPIFRVAQHSFFRRNDARRATTLELPNLLFQLPIRSFTIPYWPLHM